MKSSRASQVCAGRCACPRPANTGLRKGARRQLDSRDWISLSGTVHTSTIGLALVCTNGRFTLSVFVLTKFYCPKCTVKPALRDHPTVQAKEAVKARWSLEPGPTVSV